MGLSLSNYSSNYIEYEGDARTTGYGLWNERFSTFIKSENANEYGERIFRPSEDIEEVINDWKKRLNQANDTIEKNWIPRNQNYENFKWTYWKEFLENVSKHKNNKALGKNERWYNGMNDVIKNHPELKSIEPELTMCLTQELLLNQYDELKNKANNQGHMIELMGGVDYNNIA